MSHFLTILLFASIFYGNIWGAEKSEERQVWISPSTVQVELQPSSSKVALQFLKETPNQSPSIEVTFFDQTGRSTSIELRSIHPSSLPRYEGSLSHLDSYIGFEVKIPLGGEKSTLIHSRDLHKVDRNGVKP